MSSLRDAVDGYLALRRSLGYQLYGHELLLHDFADFAQRNSVDTVTIELAVRWARLPKDAKPIWWATRLGVVRGFARYLATIDPRTEIPPRDLLPARAQRLAPYIYSPAEVQALMDAAAALQPPVRGATHRTLIGLLAATGLRLGEALGLDRQDVDLDDGVLRVHGKDDKWREVPLHPSATHALTDVRPPQGPSLARPGKPSVLCLQHRRATPEVGGPQDLPAADPPGRPGGVRSPSQTPTS